MPVSNLSRVVDGAQLRIESLPTATRPYAVGPTSSISTTEFLARNLVESVRPVIATGLVRQYSQGRRISPSLRGRLQVSATLRNRAKSPFAAVAVTSVFAPTVDHAMN